jgi:hypothetical protein
MRALTVISEAGLTGEFRYTLALELIECEVRVVRRDRNGKQLESWTTWRPATEADHELARLRA